MRKAPLVVGTVWPTTLAVEFVCCTRHLPNAVESKAFQHRRVYPCFSVADPFFCVYCYFTL